MEKMSGNSQVTQNCGIGIKKNKAQNKLRLAKEANINKNSLK